MMNNEIKGLGNSYTAMYWEYDSRIGRRWNLDIKPTPGLSQYSAFSNNPILYSDPLGDTIRTYSTAQVTHTTLSDKGGTRDMAQNAIDYKDAHLVPAVNNNGQLVGYNVFDSKNKDRNMPILQIEPGDVEEFKRGYNSYMGGARAVYAAGEPSEGIKLFGAGIEMQDYKLMWEGIKKENKDAWSDPVFVVSFLTMSANSAIGLRTAPARPKVLNPNEVHFMQSSIKNTTGEYTVLGNAEGLKTGTLSPTVLRITVWQDASGKIWTLDHRRLAAFRLAGLTEVPVQWATPEQVQSQMWKMSTNNGGTSIRLKLGDGQSKTVK
jgi:hypothetical protein